MIKLEEVNDKSKVLSLVLTPHLWKFPFGPDLHLQLDHLPVPKTSFLKVGSQTNFLTFLKYTKTFKWVGWINAEHGLSSGCLCNLSYIYAASGKSCDQSRV